MGKLSGEKIKELEAKLLSMGRSVKCVDPRDRAGHPPDWQVIFRNGKTFNFISSNYDGALAQAALMKPCDDDLLFEEILRQEYTLNNCIFSAGFVIGHPVDSLYLRMEKDGEDPTVILLRPDEMACIAWLAAGVLWSGEIKRLDDKEGRG